MTVRYYSSTATETTLAAAITNTAATSMTVNSVSGWPYGDGYPFTLIIDPDTASEEIVDVTNVTGTTVTITRGVDGTTAKTHALGAVVKHGVTGRDFKNSRDHENASSAVHGLAGTVVGTTDSQVLTNKSISGSYNTITNLGASALSSDSVTTVKIVDGNVTTAKIADNAITTGKIAAGAVETSDLADGAVTTIKIADNAITTGKIAAGAVETSDLADGAVTTIKIADNAITSDKIVNDTIVNADISANAAIAASKISGTAITAADIKTVTSTILGDNSVTTDKIVNDAVTTDKIVNNAVTTDKIANNTILNSDINTSAAIDATKIANGTVTNAQFQYLSGTTSTIQTQINDKAAIAGQTFTGTVAAPTINATTKFQVNGTDVTGLTGAWTQGTVTSSWSAYTWTYRYIQIGKTVHLQANLPLTGAAGSNTLSLTLPHTMYNWTNAHRTIGVGTITYSTSSLYTVFCQCIDNSNTLAFVIPNIATTTNPTGKVDNLQGLTASSFTTATGNTLGSGDYIDISITYEAA